MQQNRMDNKQVIHTFYISMQQWLHNMYTCCGNFLSRTQPHMCTYLYHAHASCAWSAYELILKPILSWYGLFPHNMWVCARTHCCHALRKVLRAHACACVAGRCLHIQSPVMQSASFTIMVMCKSHVHSFITNCCNLLCINPFSQKRKEAQVEQSQINLTKSNVNIIYFRNLINKLCKLIRLI